MKKLKSIFFKILLALGILYVALLWPEAETPLHLPATGRPAFIWNKDSVWQALENNFNRARQMDTSLLDSFIRQQQKIIQADVALIHQQAYPFTHPVFARIENNFFALAPFVAAMPKHCNQYLQQYSQLRHLIKIQSQQWPLQETAAHNTLYRLLYGMRAASEEVLLQMKQDVIPAASYVNNSFSPTPSATLLGIRVHSGDILVSRGGAEVSALIARGNDYPGNFSHIALLYVDENSGEPLFIESHIEKGVAIANAAQYMADPKLRFMVLRPGNHLAATKADALLPHKAAKAMYQAARARHIPYDFKMNYSDSAEMFCSEVASFAYQCKGIRLWPFLSTISAAGITQWLHAFGVENFVTQMPSDLEYDPQLNTVAEWRPVQTLYKDHIDNAAMDALLEQANNGLQVGYRHWQLPFVRVLKAWCVVKNKWGYPSIIPEGMSASTALKNQWLVNSHRQIAQSVKADALLFEKEKHYRPPYWQLLAFARKELQQ